MERSPPPMNAFLPPMNTILPQIAEPSRSVAVSVAD
jgi:hypothetical protein